MITDDKHVSKVLMCVKTISRLVAPFLLFALAFYELKGPSSESWSNFINDSPFVKYGILILAVFLLVAAIILRELFIKRKRWKKYVFFLLAIALRLWYGELIGLWLPATEFLDDALMIRYADLPSYFAGIAVESRNIMLKEMGMPLVLNVVSLIGIRYSTFLSLLWIIDALLTAFLIGLLLNLEEDHSETLVKISFLLVLFLPVAFERWNGTRIYRNALLTPLYFLVLLISFLLLFCLLNKGEDNLNWKKCALYSVALGVVLTLTYYIKEDGLWILVTILFLLSLCCAVLVCRAHNKEVKWNHTIRLSILIVTIPFLIFGISTVVYKSVNRHYFGIYETNARTSGEEAEFVQKVYQVDSNERTIEIWAPTDALKKVFQESKTLRENTRLKDAVFHTQWYGGSIEDNPIQGDFLTWVLKDALFDSETVSSKQEAEWYMAGINDELDVAFREGRLQRDSRFQLVHSVGGITQAEFQTLLQSTVRAFRLHILLPLYQQGGIIQNNYTDEVVQNASALTNMHIGGAQSYSAEQYRRLKVVTANIIAGILFNAYRIIQPILSVIAIVASTISVVHLMRRLRKGYFNIRRSVVTLLTIALTGISFAYLFLISWFCAFLNNDYVLQFYSMGFVPLLTFVELFGLVLTRYSLQNSNT